MTTCVDLVSKAIVTTNKPYASDNQAFTNNNVYQSKEISNAFRNV